MRRIALVVGLAVALAAAPAALGSSPQSVVFTMARDFNVGSDTWSATGAVADAGPFTDDPAFFAGHSLTLHGDRTLTGRFGTLTLRFDVRLIPTSDPNVFAVTGRWSALRGTGSYAALHGAGTVDEVFNVAAGTVGGNWSGFMVTDP